MLKETVSLRVAGRAYNRWLVRVWRLDPGGEWVPQTLVDWGPFWGELRKAADEALAASLVVSVSPFAPDGTAVDPDAGYLLLELTRVESVKLDDTGLLRGALDVHGRNPAGAPERLVRGVWTQVLGITESSS